MGSVCTNVLPIRHDQVVAGVVVLQEHGLHLHRENLDVDRDLAPRTASVWMALADVARTGTVEQFEAAASATWDNWSTLPAAVRADARTWIIARG